MPRPDVLPSLARSPIPSLDPLRGLLSHGGAPGLFHELRGPDPHLVQEAEGTGHQELVEDVGGRGQDSGDDEVREDSVLAILGEKLGGEEGQGGGESDEEGELKDETEGQHELDREIDEEADREHRREVLGLIGEEEAHGEREDEEVTEEEPDEEEDGAEDDEGEGKAPLPLKQTGGDESPHLEEDHGRGKDEPGEEADLDMGPEGLGRREEDQLGRRLRGDDQVGRALLKGKGGAEHPLQEGQDLLGEVEGDREADADGDERDDQSPSELLQVGEERHLVISHRADHPWAERARKERFGGQRREVAVKVFPLP